MLDNQQPANNTAVSSAIVEQSPNQYNIEGVVDFSTVPALIKQVKSALNTVKKTDKTPLIIDLSKVGACNSAALVLILEIVKFANKIKLNLKFENVPDSLLKIAAAYGIETEIRDFIK